MPYKSEVLTNQIEACGDCCGHISTNKYILYHQRHTHKHKHKHVHEQNQHFDKPIFQHSGLYHRRHTHKHTHKHKHIHKQNQKIEKRVDEEIETAVNYSEKECTIPDPAEILRGVYAAN